MEQRIKHKQCLICGSSNLQKVFLVKDHSISQETFDLFDCQNCGFRFTQSIPTQTAIGPYYQSEDYISHSDTKKGLINRLYHIGRNFMLQRKFRLIKRHASLDSLLDVGSGTGYFLNFLQQRDFKVQGIEVDEKARTYAKEQFGVSVDAPSSLLEDKLAGPYGAISMWHVLEHVHQPDIYLQKLYQLLDDKGALLVAVPNYSALDGSIYQSYWAGYDVPRHLWHFAPDTLSSLAERNGFQVVEKNRMPLDPFYVALLSEKYKKSGGLGLFKAFINGLRSHMKSLANVDKSSSIIYVLKKK